MLRIIVTDMNNEGLRVMKDEGLRVMKGGNVLTQAE